MLSFSHTFGTIFYYDFTTRTAFKFFCLVMKLFSNFKKLQYITEKFFHITSSVVRMFSFYPAAGDASEVSDPSLYNFILTNQVEKASISIITPPFNINIIEFTFEIKEDPNGKKLALLFFSPSRKRKDKCI